MIYVRNIFKQDLRKGKQIAFPKEPSISFFNFNYQKSDGESERQITFRLNSRELNSSFRSKDGHEITTRLYGANSESRIDGELKAFLRDELNAAVGDVMVFTRIKNDLFGFELIPVSSEYHESFKAILKGGNHEVILHDSIQAPHSDEESVSHFNNLKEEFADYFISLDGVKHQYFRNSFNSNKNNLIESLSEYESVYAAEYGSSVFSFDLVDKKEFLISLKENLYQDSGEFYEFSRNTSTHMPRAILGDKNYLLFLEYKLDHNEPSNSLNQIFFGPPGTGKTYNTINEALKIVDPKFYAALKDDRSALRARFQELQLNDDNEAKGQIGFATFHQSMSYEDFIEGIKPSPPEVGDEFLKYTIEDGIFKNMCRIAGDSLVTSPGEPALSLTASQFEKAEFYKTSLGNTRDRDDDEVYDYCIANGFISLGFGGGLDYSGKSEADIRKIGVQEGLGAYDVTAMNLFVNHLKEGSFVVVSNGNRYVRAIGKVTGPYEFKEQSPFPNNPHWNHFRQVDWSYAGKDIPSGELYNKNLSQMTIYKMDKREVNPAFFLKEKDDLVQKKSKNYVLIIDEINRGNVSAIFGELITLIEPNKRAGQREALSATLPYSKATFSVPSNLHIIGTMNTADRSVEALDSALRRRFSFKEMAPDSTIIANHGKLKSSKGVIKPEGIDLPCMLDAINRRIELLRDKDYRIGHSYVMEVETVQDLKVAFKDKIIPLLEEYFFSDMGKLSLILGGKFIEPSEAQAESVFAGNHGYDEVLVNELLERRVYHVAPEEKWDFKSIYAS